MPKLVNKFSFSKPKKPKITVFAAKSTDLMIPLWKSVKKGEKIKLSWYLSPQWWGKALSYLYYFILVLCMEKAEWHGKEVLRAASAAEAESRC